MTTFGDIISSNIVPNKNSKNVFIDWIFCPMKKKILLEMTVRTIFIALLKAQSVITYYTFLVLSTK